MHCFYNFKGFERAHIELLRPMTILIGRNGSGKTNIIEGVELLAQLASGRALHEIDDIGSANNNFEIRGGLQGCERKGLQDNTFGFYFDNTTYNKTNLHILYSIDFVFDKQVTLFKEFLQINNNILLFKATQFNQGSGQLELNGILNISYENFLPNPQPILQLPADKTVLSRYTSHIIPQLYKQHVAEEYINQAISIADNLKTYLSSAFVFDLNPHLMRQYERIGAKQLNKSGSNLSSVLYTIKINDDNKKLSDKLLPKLLDKLKQLPEEPFIDFEFITTQANDVLLSLKREDGLIIDARLLSDGTLRTLAILTALETIPEHSRMVIEELDNGVHPSRVKLLVDTIWECSHRRNLNVLVTTHNPATLNGLTPEQLDCVVVCHYDPIEKADKLTALPDIPDSDILLQKGSLGDLVTRNVLESYLMPNFVEEQKQKAQEWLDLF